METAALSAAEQPEQPKQPKPTVQAPEPAANPPPATAAAAAAAEGPLRSKRPRRAAAAPVAVKAAGGGKRGRGMEQAARDSTQELVRWERMEQGAMAMKRGDEVFREFYPVGASACTAARHSGRVNCADNCNCLFGLGEAARPGAKSAKGARKATAATAGGGGGSPRRALRALTRDREQPAGASVLSAADVRRADPMGLLNLGNTCYANSILQMLFWSLTFRRGLFSCGFDAQRFTTIEESASVLGVARRPGLFCYQLQRLFTHLQDGICSAFNPEEFVTAINLQPAFQQDVSEFLKLLLAQVERELSGGPSAETRDLVQKTFEGALSHTTTCGKCVQESESSSRTLPFYELMLQPTDQATLEQALNDYLAAEEMRGSEQCFCSTCGCKEDATRRVKLRRIPETLCVQLSRFTYDLKTGTKKKSHARFSFPSVVDMSAHVASSGEYDLTGVLIHAGASANAGHYTAHLQDQISGQWWKFDDESVKPLSSAELGSESELLVENFDAGQTSTAAKGAGGAAKRAKTEPGSQDTIRMSSNAYMLIYTHRVAGSSQATSLPDAPDALACRTEGDNDALRAEVQKASQSAGAEAHRMDLHRQHYQEVVAAMPAKTSDKYYWLSAAWMKQWAAGAAEIGKIDNADISCAHFKLDPRKASLAKRVSKEAWKAFKDKYGVAPRATLTESDFCPHCVQTLCTDRHERLGQVDADNQALVLLQNEPVAGSDGFWMSKQWLRDWKPQNQALQGKALTANPWTSKKRKGSAAPAPVADSKPELNLTLQADLICRHGNLDPDMKRRRGVSPECWQWFKRRYGNGRGTAEFSLTAPPCAECVAASEAASAVATAMKDHLKDVRSKLPTVFKKTSMRFEDMDVGRSAASPWAVISTAWLDEWRQFAKALKKHAVKPPPLNCASIMCEHRMLLYDPRPDLINLSQFGEKLSMLTVADYAVLRSEYGGDEPVLFWLPESSSDAPPSEDVKVADEASKMLVQVEAEADAHRRNSMPHVASASDRAAGEAADASAGSSVRVCADCLRLKQRHELEARLEYVKATIKVRHVNQPPTADGGAARPAEAAAEAPRRASARRGAGRKSLNSMTLTCSSDDTVVMLKFKIIQESTATNELFPNQLQLYHDSVLLDELATLRSANVEAGAEILMTINHAIAGSYGALFDADSGEPEAGFAGSLLHS